MGSDSLTALLAPTSIAVIGASRRPDTIGHQILHNLIAHGFSGTVFPVNPRARSICSVRAYPTVRAIPETVDLGVVVVPKEHVLEVLEDCGAAGVKGLIVISAGFREAGNEGRTREQALVEIVRRYGMRMVGPNCMGIVNADPAVSMNATFATVMPPFGHAAFVSQSGALGLSVLDHAREYGIGISQFVSAGNKADVSGNDLLLHWENDPSVSVILMYVENFGNPRRFLEIAKRVTKSKPIVVVKSGRSRAGARAASSHTGALAASDSAVDALLSQAGVMRASSIEELFDMAMAFEAKSLPRSRRTAILTNAGGPGILAADAMDACGLELAELSESTVAELRPLFPAEASIRNPLDMIASATPAGYRTALESLLRDPHIDAVVPIFVPPFGVKQEAVAEAIVGAAATSEKPVFAVLMGREGLPTGRAELQQAGIPTYVFPESASRALSSLNRHVEWAACPQASPTPLAGIDRGAAKAIFERVATEGREQLTQIEALDVLRAYGIPTVRGSIAATADDAARTASEIRYPIALKIVSADVVHKTEVGGVRLDIESEAELRAAYAEMLARVKSAMPGARIAGVMVQQTVADGCEVIVGMTRDPSFGPVLMFGLGGIFVEVLRDVVFRMPPLADTEAAAMIASIRGVAMLDGARGAPPADRMALVSVIRRIGELAVDCPELCELDVNPFVAHSRGGVAVDARMRLAPG